MKLLCKYCDIEFIHSSPNRKFCSRKCYGMFRSISQVGENNPTWIGGKTTQICLACGKDFKTYRRSENVISAYCSTACKPSHLKGKASPFYIERVTLECPQCGIMFATQRAWAKKQGNHFCSRVCRAIWVVANMNKANTTIELIMEKELLSRNIIYKKQTPIMNIGIPDFIVGDIIIQCDGDYWHNLPTVFEKDKAQDILYTNIGFKVFRFWERDIHKNVAACVETIQKYMKDNL